MTRPGSTTVIRWVWKSHLRVGATMSYSRCASLVLALAVSACASSGGTSSGEAEQTDARAARGNSTLIVRAELEELGGRSLWDAVQLLRGRWLQPQRNSSFVSGPAYARVVVDGIVRGDLGELRGFDVDDIETMRYVSAPDATTKYGTGYLGGVIEVSTRGRGR